MNALFMICCVIIAGLSLFGYIKGFTKIVIPIIVTAVPLIFLYILNNWLLGFLLHWTFSGGELILTRIVVVLLSLILCRVGFKLAIRILRWIPHLPLIHGADKILGLLTGTIEGALLIWLFLYLVNINQGFLLGKEWGGMIEENPFLLFLYQNNLIEHLVATVFSGWFA